MPEIDKERELQPIEIAPIPPYEYPTNTPGTERSKVPVTPLPVQPVRDLERVTMPEQRESVPVSPSPTRTRTKPFLPARRDPDREQMTTVHVVHTEPLPYSRQGAPETQKSEPDPTQKPAACVYEYVPTNVSPVSKPNLPNRAQIDNLANNLAPTSEQQKPTQKQKPHITMPLSEKFTFVGRGVGRDRTFYEVIDLLNFTQCRGDFPDGTTDRM